jgi:hypothetical protein
MHISMNASKFSFLLLHEVPFDGNESFAAFFSNAGSYV